MDQRFEAIPTSARLLFIAAAGLACMAAAHAQTTAVSATTDPTNGYPLWYQDASTPGIRVEPCLDSKDPFCVLLADPGYNPSNPLLFPTNFPVEFFYFVADSDKLSTPGCPASSILPGTAKYRAAVEGSFLTGVQQAGNQSAFARTRIVASGLCPNTTYTFTTPYGADAVTTDSAGAVVANKKGATIDIGCAAAPCNFSAPLASRVFGGFLRFDPVSNTPPAGYLGDKGPVAGTLSPIIGSPTGTNLFSITDPAGKVLASTNLFTVSGKIAGPLMSSPTALDFGGQTAGTPSTARTVTITNVYPASITITSLSFTGANLGDFSASGDLCTGKTLAQDQSCTIGVTFLPTTTAVERAQLNVFHNGPFRSPRIVNVTGTGTASTSAPAVSLSATSLAFGSLRVKTTSAAQTVTVSNTGTAPLGATASLINADPNLFPPGADQFTIVSNSCNGNFVPSGGTCSVSVVFNPTVETLPNGSTALLRFTDNAANSPQDVTVTGTGTGGIAAVSATLNAFGYPNWYQDDNGIQVQPCLDSADPYCVLLPDPRYNPALPLNFTPSTPLASINFPVEAFYFVADSDVINTPGCPAAGIGPGKAKYRAAVEGSFLTGLQSWGQQSAFARTRIVVVSGLCPNTTYAFTHPYGTDLVTTDASGGVVANKKGATVDTGCLGAPCNFSSELSSRVMGGMLKWDPAVAPAAPAGHLGDAGPVAGTMHTVVGSPYKDPVTGTPANFFRIADPLTGAVIAQTSLFRVSGKLATPITFPGPLAFGSVMVGSTSAPQTLTLTNSGAVSAAISTASILATPGGAASLNFTKGADACSGATLAPAATCTIAVSFTPTVAGSLAGVVEITSAALSSPLEVPLSGTGVTAATTTTNISAPAVTSPANGLVTVTVSSAAGTPTGSVSLTVDGGTPIPQALVNGSITFTLTSPAVGSHTLSASYAAQGSFAASSASGTLVVNSAAPSATTTTISAPAVTSPANGLVTVTVSSAAGIPTGTVSLAVDGGAAIPQTLVNGSFTFTLTSPTVGTHTLSASYAAQGSYAASSAVGTLVVNAPVVKPTAADTLTITAATARLKGTTYLWTINGTTSIPAGNTITVTLTRTGQVIGTATPKGGGGWTVKVGGSSVVPIAGDTVTATSALGATPVSGTVTIQ